jgi:hypothetical protein
MEGMLNVSQVVTKQPGTELVRNCLLSGLCSLQMPITVMSGELHVSTAAFSTAAWHVLYLLLLHEILEDIIENVLWHYLKQKAKDIPD